MPIQTAVPIRTFDQEAFHKVDHRVTGMAFAIHNELGRYLDEKLYQRELTRCCRDVGMNVFPEMRITVSFGDFAKDYYVDHLVNGGVIIETKAATALSQAHRGQTLNYLFLCGLCHGTLLNFGAQRVQHEFVSTRLTHAIRQPQFNEFDWLPLSAACQQLRDVMQQVGTEWGAFLDPVLYRDACAHFLGKGASIFHDVEVYSAGETIGTQKMPMLSEDIAFSVTAATHRPDSVLDHQRRFLNHTPLRALQWINLNHHRIEFRTITKS